MSNVLLCGACAAGRPEDCSGWCGVEASTWVGPVQPHVWEELREIGCDVDPWEDAE